MSVIKFITHSKRAIQIARTYGWLPGARYTNLRDVKTFDRVGFLDIDWQNYNFANHLKAVRAVRPSLTVARDILRLCELDRVLDQARSLAEWSDHVIIVPKDPKMADLLGHIIPKEFILGYSVPTRYGGTPIDTKYFTRPVHLLGGRPDRQRKCASEMPVISLDCNRFTLDAAFGDYFTGVKFEPHPRGGYINCLRDSVCNISKLWQDYHITMRPDGWNIETKAA